MKIVKRQPWWKRRQTLSAGESAMLGLAVGVAAAVAAALNPPRDFSFGFLALLLLSLGPCGGIAGYMFWFVCDPAREQWLRRIAMVVAVFFLIVLFIAVPSFWRETDRAMGPSIVGLFICFAFAMAHYLVAAGIGIAHFVRHVAHAVRRHADPESAECAGGVWDRELDQS